MQNGSSSHNTEIVYFGELCLKPVLTTTVTQLPLLDPTSNCKYPAMTTQEQITKSCDLTKLEETSDARSGQHSYRGHRRKSLHHQMRTRSPEHLLIRMQPPMIHQHNSERIRTSAHHYHPSDGILVDCRKIRDFERGLSNSKDFVVRFDFNKFIMYNHNNHSSCIMSLSMSSTRFQPSSIPRVIILTATFKSNET